MKETDALKFVWAYMIQNGEVTTGEWSYYGCRWNDRDPKRGWDKPEINDVQRLVKQHGIDWEKTSVPESSQNNEFNGTFAESGRTECLLGTLVLNNGQSWLIGTKDTDQRFSGYLEHLSKLAEDKAMVKNILGEDIC